ncbi:MAG: hypothetical protein AAF849_15690 [Bacteroidota bacterium]
MKALFHFFNIYAMILGCLLFSVPALFGQQNAVMTHLDTAFIDTKMPVGVSDLFEENSIFRNSKRSNINRAKVIASRELNAIRRTYNQTIKTSTDHYFLFDYDESDLINTADSLLDFHYKQVAAIKRMIDLLLKYEIDSNLLNLRPTITINFQILGFASPEGSADYNLKLAEYRANRLLSLIDQEQENEAARYDFKVTYCAYAKGENVLREMTALEDRYKRSAIILLDCIDYLEDEALCDTCLTRIRATTNQLQFD